MSAEMLALQAAARAALITAYGTQPRMALYDLARDLQVAVHYQDVTTDVELTLDRYLTDEERDLVLQEAVEYDPYVDHTDVPGEFASRIVRSLGLKAAGE